MAKTWSLYLNLLKTVLFFLLALSPPAMSFFILGRTVVPIPVMDDYDAILYFANQYQQLHSFKAKLLLINNSVHVQYKLIFLHTIVASSLALYGRISFIFLQCLGSSFLLLIAACLWCLMPSNSFQRKLVLFIPASLLIFVLRENDVLNASTASLQQIAVIGFAVLALMLLAKEGKFYYACGLLACVFGAWSSVNGFLVFPLAAAMLWERRFITRAAVLSVACILLAAAYAYQYHAGPPDLPTKTSSPLIIPFFFLSLLGDVFSRAWLSIPLGVLLCLTAGTLIVQGARNKRRMDPLCAGMMFFLLNAFLITLGRFRFTLEGSLTSRYSLYSQIFCALIYIAWLSRAERLKEKHHTLPLFNVMYGVVLLCSLLLFAKYERVGARLQRERRQALLMHMAQWEQFGPQVSPATVDVAEAGDSMKLWLRHASSVLVESVRLGVYTPPQILLTSLPRSSSF